jgi:hypothetical protein
MMSRNRAAEDPEDTTRKAKGTALLAFFLFLAIAMVLPPQSYAATAVGCAYGKKLFIGGKPLGSDSPPYRSIFKERIFLPSHLPPLPGEGAFTCVISKDFLAGGVEQGKWERFSEPPVCYVDDGALAFRIKCPARPVRGIYTFRWRFTSPGGATAAVEWEYRVLSKSYARLVAKTDEGISRGAYGGEPVESLDLTAGILLSPSLASIDDETLEKMLAGTWTVTEELQGEKGRTFHFELRMLALRKLTLSPPVYCSSPAGSEPMVIRAEMVSLPVGASEIKGTWQPELITWRLVATRDRRQGEMIIHKAWGQFSPSAMKGERDADLSHQWTGVSDGDPGPAEHGQGRILLQALGRVKDRWVKCQVKSIGYKVKGVPRILVSDSQGLIIADSRDNELLPLLGRKARNEYRLPSIPHDITFVPAGNGILEAPFPTRSLEDLHFSHIYQKSAEKDVKLVIDVNGIPQDIRESSLVITTNLPGRQEVSVPLKRTGNGPAFCAVQATSSERVTAGSLFVGSRKGEKSFAILDLTHLEDTDMLKSILQSRGWHSRGEMSSATSGDPFMVRSGRDFMRAGGFETITITCPDLPLLKAILHIKNQADLLYYGGHGWGNGYIALREGYLLPGRDVQKGDWSDNLKVIIFSSCSNLDISNYNGRSFTAYGKIKDSPGMEWADAAGPQVALLGYNWSTQEGNPPNAFDTRVVKRYFSYWPQHTPPSAWIYANILEGDSVAPCAIYKNSYYFIQGATGRILAVPGDAWRSGRLPPSCETVPWPSR